MAGSLKQKKTLDKHRLKNIYLILIAGLLLTACAKRPKSHQVLPYEGEAVSIREAYHQKEIAGEQKDSSFNYLHVELYIAEDAEVVLQSLKFEGVEYHLDNLKLTYKLKIPSSIDLLNKRAKYVCLYFSLDSQEVLLMKAVSTKEPLFLP